MRKLIRVTTIPLSLEKLLEGQLTFMSNYYDVTAVSAEKDRLVSYGDNNGVNTYHVELTRAITPVKDLQAVWKLTKFLKREKPLIIHTHTPKAGIIGMLAGRLANVPICLHTVAGLPLLEVTGTKRKILDQVEKTTYSLAHKVYPNSHELERIILNLQYAEASKLKVLGNGSSNGIDTEYFNPAVYNSEFKYDLKKKLGIPTENFVYIFVGRLVKEKGINELIKAFSLLNAQYEHTSLLLVGPLEQDLDPLEEQTLKTIEEHPKIFTTGYQVDVRPYFAISNVLTFPSYREGFPNVVLQAGAMSLPSIVTNINGCNEIVIENQNGLIIPVKNSSALKSAMQRLYEKPDFCSKLTINARQLIQKKFERGKFWKVLLKEYQELEAKLKHH